VATVNIGGKQVSVTPLGSKQAGGTYITEHGAVSTAFPEKYKYAIPISGASFGGGGLPSKGSSVVGGVSTVLQQKAAAARAKVLRQVDLRNRQRDLGVKSAALGQEQTAIRNQERELQRLQARISEAAKKPLTTDVFVNKLISEHAKKATALQNRASSFNERIGSYNAEARGLSEQFQVRQVAELKTVSPKVELRRTPKGTLFTSFTSPETLRKQAIAEQRLRPPLREQFGLEAAEATIVGGRLEREATERALRGEIPGLPGKVALQKATVARLEKKKPFAVTGFVPSLGLTVGEKESLPLVKEAVARVEKPGRAKVRLLAERGDILGASFETGELIGRKFFEIGQRGETPKGLEFKRGVEKETKEFLGLQRTPLGTDEFSLFVGTPKERQAKFGAAGRGITQLAALELAFAGTDIGVKFAKSGKVGKTLKSFDIGEVGAIGKGKKKVFKLPEIASIKSGDIKGTFTVKEPKLFVFSKPKSGVVAIKEPKVFTFTKPKSGIVTIKEPKVFRFVAKPSAKDATKKIKVFRFDTPSGLVTLTKTKPRAIIATKPTFLNVGKLKDFDTTAGLVTKPQLKFKKFVGKVTEISKPFKKVEKDVGFFTTTKFSPAEAIERGSIFKEIKAAEIRIARVSRVAKVIKPKPAPFLSLEVPGSATALGVGLPKRPRGKFEEIEFITTRAGIGEIPKLKEVQITPFRLKTEPVSIRRQRPLFKTGFKTELGLKTSPVSITKQRQFLDIGLKTDILPTTKQIFPTKLKTELALKLKPVSISAVVPIQASLARTLEKQRQETVPIQRIVPIDLSISRARARRKVIPTPRPIPKLGIESPFVEVTRPRIPLIPLFDLPRRPKKAFETFGYKVFVRAKGKKTKKGWKPGKFIAETEGVLPRKEALAFGQSLVAGTAKRTFKLVPSVGKRTRVGKIPKFRAEMFRVKGRIFVEKSRFALAQPGERREITEVGLQKLRLFPRLRKKKGIKMKKRKKQVKKKRPKKK